MRAVTVAALCRHTRRPGLKCTSRIPVGVFQCQSFAVAAADDKVGTIKEIERPRRFAERPPEQQRADRAEHERMMRSTQRILSFKTLTPGTVQEFRVVLHYWTSSRPHAIAEAMDGGKHRILRQNDALLEWILSCKIDAESLYTILRTNDCVCGALINMIEQHLMPFRGTHQSLKTLSDRRLRSNQNVDELKTGLMNATKIMDLVQNLLNDSAYPKLVPEPYVYDMMLNLWVKRCWFLAEHSDFLDDKFVQTALKGAENVKEGLEAMKDCIDTLPLSGPSNTTALHMAAWTSSHLPNRVEKLEAILRDAEENPSVSLNEVPYNTLMHAYATSAQYNKEHAARAGTLLRHMWSRGIECDVSTYSSLLLALSNAGNPDRAIELLTEMEEQAERTEIFPNTICYNIVLDSLAKQRTKESAMRAEALLRRMESMSEEEVNPLSAPDTVSFTSVIRAWAKSRTADAAEKAESILLQCIERSVKTKSIAPDDMMFNTVLQAWTEHTESQKGRFDRRKGRGETGARRAESLLQLMKESGDIEPDEVSYNIIMNAWYNSGNHKAAAERTRELFKEMKSEYLAGDNSKKPDDITYNTVIKTIVQSRSPGCVDEAQDLVEEMKAEGLKLKTTTYNHLMAGIVKSGERDAVERAEGLLEDMGEMYKNGNKDVRPSEISFNILLHAYAKSKDPRNAKKAERLLNRMVETLEQDGREGSDQSAQSFASVLNAYASCGESEAAENLFDRMASSGKVHVNTITYNTVLNAFSKSRAEDAPHRAETLLNRMQEEYEAGNEEVRPNVISFSSVLNCWARSGLEGAAERAESILLRMQDLASRGSIHVAPNVICFSTVLNAWSKSKDPDSANRAIGIFDRMEEAYENGQENARPNSYCYNATMNAIAKSSLADKAEVSYQLLQRMVKAHKKDQGAVIPSVTSYSTVLNACAYTEGSPEQKKEAFRIARTTFAEFLESDYGDPNVVTYVNFLTACFRLIPVGPARDNLMVAVFRECHEKGLVNDKAVSVLRRGVTPDVFFETMSSLELS